MARPTCCLTNHDGLVRPHEGMKTGVVLRQGIRLAACVYVPGADGHQLNRSTDRPMSFRTAERNLVGWGAMDSNGVGPTSRSLVETLLEKDSSKDDTSPVGQLILSKTMESAGGRIRCLAHRSAFTSNRPWRWAVATTKYEDRRRPLAGAMVRAGTVAHQQSGSSPSRG